VPEASPVTSKVLVIATQRTISGARLALALADAGFGVAALTPLGHPVRWSGKIQNHFAYTPFSSIIRAIAKWDPDLLVCTDDLAVAKLQALYYRTAASRDITRHRISKLITTSLVEGFAFALRTDRPTCAPLRGSSRRQRDGEAFSDGFSAPCSHRRP
jgi:hypothetical protein